MAEICYLDNAATSWPKPPCVHEAMAEYMAERGGNPGRSGHRLSIEAQRVLVEARETVARFFGFAWPERVVFTKNITEALNLAIFGIVRPGDRVVVGGMEHNSVMRPIRHLERTAGVEVVKVPYPETGVPDLRDFERLITRGTRLVVVNHASNVNGALADVQAITRIAHSVNVPVLVDAAQTAGAYPIDLGDSGIDLLAFTGHKGLLGPQGTGGICIGNAIDPEPLLRGGTGSQSEKEEQPDFCPDKYESGTPNGVGIAGLLAGVRFIAERGVDSIRKHEIALLERFEEGCRAIRGVRVYSPGDPGAQVGVISINVDGLVCSDVSAALDEEFSIMTRPGLHCAPSAHASLGTLPSGTVRFSFGPFTTTAHIDLALSAVEAIANAAGARG